jgi:N-acetylneuraminic acid mutarotase
VYSDGTLADVTNMAIWTSSAQGVVTIGPTTGLETGISLGPAKIAATFGSITATEPALVVAATWVHTGPLAVARFSHTATVLPNGMVLVAGGCCGLNYPEFYDPALGTWSSKCCGGPDSFLGFTATLLANGKVLFAGGQQMTDEGIATAAVDLYDSVSGTWSAAASLPSALVGHTATLLASGKVLVAGGAGSTAFGVISTANALLYDPVSDAWSATGNLVAPVSNATATLLSNGKVLVVAGSIAQLYDPVTGTWSATGSLATARYAQTATLLSNGKVLVTGGTNGATSDAGLSSAELYDPVAGIWSNTGGLITARYSHTATLLPNGTVLVAGGYNSSLIPLGSAELYDPVAGTWTATGSLLMARVFHAASLLPNGVVLVSGGITAASNGDPDVTAELYY